jgi:hypothetical protein
MLTFVTTPAERMSTHGCGLGASAAGHGAGAVETSSAALSDEHLPDQQPDDPEDGPYIVGLFGKPIPVSRLKTRRRRFGRRR